MNANTASAGLLMPAVLLSIARKMYGSARITKRRRTMMFNNNEMFAIWISMLMERNSVSEIKELTPEMISEEVKEARAAIGNEKTWAGASTSMESSMHSKNTETLTEYIEYLKMLLPSKHELELVLGIYANPNELPERIVFCVPEEITMNDLRKALVTARDKAARNFTVACSETAFESVLNEVCAEFGQKSYWYRAKLESLYGKEDFWDMKI